MKRFSTNTKMVNYGIALALFGILVFSLMASVEGMVDKKETNTLKDLKNKTKNALKTATAKAKAAMESKESLSSKTKHD